MKRVPTNKPCPACSKDQDHLVYHGDGICPEGEGPAAGPELE